MGVCTFEFRRSLCRQWQFLRFQACLYGLLKTFVPFSTSELRSAALQRYVYPTDEEQEGLFIIHHHFY